MQVALRHCNMQTTPYLRKLMRRQLSTSEPAPGKPHSSNWTHRTLRPLTSCAKARTMSCATSVVKRRRAEYTSDSHTVICGKSHKCYLDKQCRKLEYGVASIHACKHAAAKLLLQWARIIATIQKRTKDDRAYIWRVNVTLFHVAHHSCEGILNLRISTHLYVTCYLASCTPQTFS